MANNTLVLCKPLCFLVTKFGKLEQKVIKTALLDYYTTAEITEAKTQLVLDIAGLQLTRSSPHTPQRRDGENRSILEIDDVFKLINFLDESKLLDQLPKYVTDNPDAMPSLRLFEGDLSHIILKMDRIENRLDNKITCINSSVVAIAHDISVINNDIHRVTTQSWPAESDQQQQSLQPPGSSHFNTEKPTYASAVGRVAGGASSNQANCGYKQRPKAASDNLTSNNNSSWSVRCSTPVNKATQRVSSKLASNKPSISSDSEFTDHRIDSNEDQGYSVKQSRKKRLRNNQLKDDGGQSATRPTSKETRRGPLIIGVSSPSKQLMSNIKAAKKTTHLRKSIFCIGNIDPSCSIDDICDHVTAMSVRVISCYEAKPRRRRTDNEDEEIVDRKAFRLCINSEDVDRLLDSEKWPAHVYIAEWFFKAAGTAAATKVQPQPVTQPTSAVAAQDNTHRIHQLAQSIDAKLNKNVNIFENLVHEDTGGNESMADDDDDEETILEVTVLPEDGSKS
jgi:hypothetical protein